jgi:hypothetical protein
VREQVTQVVEQYIAAVRHNDASAAHENDAAWMGRFCYGRVISMPVVAPGGTFA